MQRKNSASIQYICAHHTLLHNIATTAGAESTEARIVPGKQSDQIRIAERWFHEKTGKSADNAENNHEKEYLPSAVSNMTIKALRFMVIYMRISVF